MVNKNYTQREKLLKILNSATIKTLNGLLEFCGIKLSRPASRIRKIRFLVQYFESLL